MNALLYLVMTQLKNRILTLRRKPVLLISYIIVALLIILAIVSSNMSKNPKSPADFADEKILFAILAGVGILFLGLYVNTGLSTGSTLFSMADAGLLFPAPISPKKILLYGLVSTLGKTLLTSLFILYQVGNLRINFGYGVKEIAGLFLIYMTMLMFGQLTSIAVYMFSNGNERRKNLVRTVLIAAAVGLLLAVIGVHRQHDEGIAATIYRVIDSKWFEYIPMSGWVLMFFKGFVQGITGKAIMSLALFAASGALILSCIASGRADYYEDVLVSIELIYKKQLAVRENKAYTGRTRKKVRVREGEKGLRGTGAAVIAYKHILEAMRKNRIPFINGFTIIAAVAAMIAAKSIKGNTAGIYGFLGFLIYLQCFTTMFGPLKIELKKPYIYLIPEQSLKKILAASATSFIKPCIDAVIIFTVFTAFKGTDPLTALFLALAYAATGAVFVGMTVMYQKVLGGQPNFMLRGVIGIALLLVILIPAVASAVISAILLPPALSFLCMVPFALVCLLSTLVIFIICSDLLDKADLT